MPILARVVDVVIRVDAHKHTHAAAVAIAAPAPPPRRSPQTPTLTAAPASTWDTETRTDVEVLRYRARRIAVMQTESAAHEQAIPPSSRRGQRLRRPPTQRALHAVGWCRLGYDRSVSQEHPRP